MPVWNSAYRLSPKRLLRTWRMAMKLFSAVSVGKHSAVQSDGTCAQVAPRVAQHACSVFGEAQLMSLEGLRHSRQSLQLATHLVLSLTKRCSRRTALRHADLKRAAGPVAFRCSLTAEGARQMSSGSTKRGKRERPSMSCGIAMPAIPRKVGARSTSVVGCSRVEPGRIPGPRMRRGMRLKPVVGGEDKIGPIVNPSPLTQLNHRRHDVVDRHQCSPSVAERAGDDRGGLGGEHGTGGNIPVVTGTQLGGAVPIRRPWLHARPCAIPVVCVPRCRRERFVRRLWGHICKEWARSLRDRFHPSERDIPNDGCRVVVNTAPPQTIFDTEACEVTGVKLGRHKVLPSEHQRQPMVKVCRHKMDAVE
eukprot:4309199-Prymnesium_polylepis.1